MSVQPPSSTPTQTQSKTNRATVITLVVIAVILAVLAAVLLQNVASRRHQAAAASQAPASSSDSAAAVPEPEPAPPVADQQTLELIHSEIHRDPADGQAKGKVDAPVVMVIYSDFACPFCTQFAQNVEPELNKLVEEGTLRIEWRDLAQISETSPLAAQAGRAAAKQGKFWEFHDAVYAAADPKGHPAYTEDSLVDFAKKAGVADLSKFRADMTAAETVKAVSESTNHVHSIGIQGTPFMIVGETYINGYKDADYMTAVVKSQAAKAKEAKGATGTDALTAAQRRADGAPRRPRAHPPRSLSPDSPHGRAGGRYSSITYPIDRLTSNGARSDVSNGRFTKEREHGTEHRSGCRRNEDRGRRRRRRGEGSSDDSARLPRRRPPGDH